MLAKLIAKHEFVVLQETHGNEHDLQSVRHRYPEHIVRGSFTDSLRAGGILFVIRKEFYEHYDMYGDLYRKLRIDIITPGRIAKIMFPGTPKLLPLEVFNLHVEADMNSNEAGYFVAKGVMINRLAAAIAREGRLTPC